MASARNAVAFDSGAVPLVADGQVPVILAGSGRSGERQDLDATLTGPAASVLLVLWKRLPLETTGITITGDPSAAQRIVGSAITS